MKPLHSKSRIAIFFGLLLRLIVCVLLVDLVFTLIYFVSGINLNLFIGATAIVIFIIWASKIVKK